MTQIFTGLGLGASAGSEARLGQYGLSGTTGLGAGGLSMRVNVANGNVLLQQSDGFLADFGLGMDVFQSYNSRDGHWRFNTQTQLTFNGRANTPNATVIRGPQTPSFRAGFH